MPDCTHCQEFANGLRRAAEVLKDKGSLAGRLRAIMGKTAQITVIDPITGQKVVYTQFQRLWGKVSTFADDGIKGLNYLSKLTKSSTLGNNLATVFDESNFIAGKSVAETTEMFMGLFKDVYEGIGNQAGAVQTRLSKVVQNLTDANKIKGAWMTLEVAKSKICGSLMNIKYFEEMTAAGKQGVDVVLNVLVNGARYLEVKASAGAYSASQGLAHLERLATNGANAWKEFRFVINYAAEGGLQQQEAKMAEHAADLLDSLLASRALNGAKTPQVVRDILAAVPGGSTGWLGVKGAITSGTATPLQKQAVQKLVDLFFINHSIPIPIP